MSLTICSEYLQPDVAVMSAAYLGYEPSHGCRECDVPLWQMWSSEKSEWEPYVACPFCGEEAETIRYCPSCDRPGCRNPGC
jgi:hypothetical protein